MKKIEYIQKYGEEKYEKYLERIKAWQTANPERVRAANRKLSPERNRKGGKYYEKAFFYQMNGLRHKRSLIRRMHAKRWRPFKQVIAPESQLHHQWTPSTADYKGLALVEADQHRHGFIDVIHILEGEITLLTETEIRGAVI